jgi:hypothetical protein
MTALFRKTENEHDDENENDQKEQRMVGWTFQRREEQSRFPIGHYMI